VESFGLLPHSVSIIELDRDITGSEWTCIERWVGPVLEMLASCLSPPLWNATIISGGGGAHDILKVLEKVFSARGTLLIP
jgi:hypothetical protein